MMNDNIEQQPVQRDQLRSCSGCTLDRTLLLISTQITISLCVIMFSSYQLVNLTDCHSQNMYSGLLSLIVGYWLAGNIKQR